MAKLFLVLYILFVASSKWTEKGTLAVNSVVDAFILEIKKREKPIHLVHHIHFYVYYSVILFFGHFASNKSHDRWKLEVDGRSNPPRQFYDISQVKNSINSIKKSDFSTLLLTRSLT